MALSAEKMVGGNVVGRYDEARTEFKKKWKDRSLDRSAEEEAWRRWFKDVRTSTYWLKLLGFKKKEEEDLDGQLTERTKRRAKALERSSVAISSRPVLDRVTQARSRLFKVCCSSLQSLFTLKLSPPGRTPTRCLRSSVESI